MISFSAWLERKPAGRKPRKPMPKATKKRAKMNREYTVRRKAYLEAHPGCEAIVRILDHLYDTDRDKWWGSPPTTSRATEIHHKKKPKCRYLNDESTWLAVCQWSHRWIEANKSTARQLGLLA